MKKAFTLAETMVVVVILGIIAILIIPALIQKQVESNNRTLVKKAMATYEGVLSKIVIENRFSENSELFGSEDSFAPAGNCTKTLNYFKVVRQIGDCKFKASDGLYWDISNINRVIIAFKQKNLTTESAADKETTDAFYLIGKFDGEGLLRISDLSYEQENVTFDQPYVVKLYSFILNKEVGAKAQFDDCFANNSYQCEVNGETYTKFSLPTGSYTYTRGSHSGITEEVLPKDVYISVPFQLTEAEIEESKSEDFCKNSKYKDCSKYGDAWLYAKQKCESQGSHLPSASEIIAYKSINPNIFSRYTWSGTTDTNNMPYYWWTKINDIYSDYSNNQNLQAFCISD